MKIIPISKGKFALVDNEDFKRVSKWKWTLCTSGYAQRTLNKKSDREYYKSTNLLMHRFIINTPDGLYTDHINGNKLDNRKSNLRICTASQNSANSKIRSDNSSGIKGVHFCKERQKFVAQISFNNKIRNLGRYETVELAAQAYRSASKKYFGEFSNP